MAPLFTYAASFTPTLRRFRCTGARSSQRRGSTTSAWLTNASGSPVKMGSGSSYCGSLPGKTPPASTARTTSARTTCGTRERLRRWNGIAEPCPLSEATFDRDRDALVALISHLSEADTDRRVILFQIENEPGVLTTARCHCSRCDEEFASGSWQKQWGEDAEEAFSTTSIASYIDHLTQAAKSVYDIPYYLNVAIPLEAGAVPGKYFSGGAVPWMLELFRANAPTLELDRAGHLHERLSRLRPAMLSLRAAGWPALRRRAQFRSFWPG